MLWILLMLMFLLMLNFEILSLDVYKVDACVVKSCVNVMVGVKNEGLWKVKIALCPPLLYSDFLLAKGYIFDVFDDFEIIYDFMFYWCC